MKVVARAHPNIALVKYWGKRDEVLNLPAAGSFSLTLGPISTTTAVEFDERLTADEVGLDGEDVSERRAGARISNFLDLVRTRCGEKRFARVITSNDFPTAAGLASSASGFAALALAATTAAGQELSREELSRLARQGSGSAARSLFGGFAEMKMGERDDGEDAHGVGFASEAHWDLRTLIAITAIGEKKISSTVGMRQTQKTSPLFQPWIDTVADDIEAAKTAVRARDVQALTEVAERSCLRMHATALGADPGILYWNPVTVAVIHALRAAREESGLLAFFTIDAGPHVKVFTPAEQAPRVAALLRGVPGVGDVIETQPGPAAHLL